MKTWNEWLNENANINISRFTLTDKELVYLNWDDPGLKRQDPELYVIVLKIRTKQPISKEEFALLYEEIKLINTFGGDPSDHAIAKRLIQKANKHAIKIGL